MLSRRQDLVRHLVAGDHAILLRQELHRIVDAGEVAAGHRKGARLSGPARQDHRGVLRKQRFRCDILADLHAGPELDALDGHLRHAPVDQVPFQLEVGNPVAKQAADAIGLLVEHDIVPGPRELLRAGETGRPGADHRDALAGLRGRRQRHDPALVPATVDDEVLDRLDADRIVVDVERARGLAGRGTDAAREFRKIVRRVQHVERGAPLLPVDEIVPVGDDVVDRTAALAERDAAVHAARALRRRRLVGERQHELAIILHALLRRQRDLLDARELHEAGDLAHVSARPAARRALAAPAGGSEQVSVGAVHHAAAFVRTAGAGFAAARFACISVSARLYSAGKTLTNFRRADSQSSRIASASVLPV